MYSKNVMIKLIQLASMKIVYMIHVVVMKAVTVNASVMLFKLMLK